MNTIRKILGFFGFNYCPLCGYDLKVMGWTEPSGDLNYACSNINCEDYQEGGIL